MKTADKKNKEKERIIKKAAEVFKKYGYKKTTMKNLASASGKAKSSVYYYFKSKKEIYNTVLLFEAIQYRKQVLDTVKNIKTPEKKLKAYILIRLQTDKKFSNFYTAMNIFNSGNKFVSRLKKIYDYEEFRIISNILKEGTEKNFFEIYDVKYAAVGIVTAMRGIESVILHQSKNSNVEEKIDNILNIILFGIIKR